MVSALQSIFFLSLGPAAYSMMSSSAKEPEHCGGPSSSTMTPSASSLAMPSASDASLLYQRVEPRVPEMFSLGADTRMSSLSPFLSVNNPIFHLRQRMAHGQSHGAFRHYYDPDANMMYNPNTGEHYNEEDFGALHDMAAPTKISPLLSYNNERFSVIVNAQTKGLKQKVHSKVYDPKRNQIFDPNTGEYEAPDGFDEFYGTFKNFDPTAESELVDRKFGPDFDEQGGPNWRFHESQIRKEAEMLRGVKEGKRKIRMKTERGQEKNSFEEEPEPEFYDPNTGKHDNPVEFDPLKDFGSFADLEALGSKVDPGHADQGSHDWDQLFSDFKDHGFEKEVGHY